MKKKATTEFLLLLRPNIWASFFLGLSLYLLEFTRPERTCINSVWQYYSPT